MPRPNCECTARCGDDPRLAKGKALPCNERMRERQQTLALMRTNDLLMALGHASDVLAALEDLQQLRRATQALVALMDRMEPDVPEAERGTDEEWIATKAAAVAALQGGAV